MKAAGFTTLLGVMAAISACPTLFVATLPGRSPVPAAVPAVVATLSA